MRDTALSYARKRRDPNGMGGKTKQMLVPDTMGQFLDDATQKLTLLKHARRVYSTVRARRRARPRRVTMLADKAWHGQAGVPIESVSAMHDGMVVMVSTSSQFPRDKRGKASRSAVSERLAKSPAKARPSSRRTRAPDTSSSANSPSGAPGGRTRTTKSSSTRSARPGSTTRTGGSQSMASAAQRHAEIAESIKSGEKLVREMRVQVEALRRLSAEEKRKVELMRAELSRTESQVSSKKQLLTMFADQLQQQQQQKGQPQVSACVHPIPRLRRPMSSSPLACPRVCTGHARRQGRSTTLNVEPIDNRRDPDAEQFSGVSDEQTRTLV